MQFFVKKSPYSGTCLSRTQSVSVHSAGIQDGSAKSARTGLWDTLTCTCSCLSPVHVCPSHMSMFAPHTCPCLPLTHVHVCPSPDMLLSGTQFSCSRKIPLLSVNFQPAEFHGVCAAGACKLKYLLSGCQIHAERRCFPRRTGGTQSAAADFAAVHERREFLFVV